MILICGKSIEDGFGLSYRIIQDLSLSVDKIYAIATKYLSLCNRMNDVEKLVKCIKSNISSQNEYKLCDDIIMLAIRTNSNDAPSNGKIPVENIIKLINDLEMQINCFILTGQLKSAYLLAVQHKRVHDIRRILREAERTNQIQIKKLCEKKLSAVDSKE